MSFATMPAICYPHQMRWLLAVTLAIGMIGVGCLDSPGCPCGAEPEDPFAEHDSSYSGQHVVDGRMRLSVRRRSPLRPSRRR